MRDLDMEDHLRRLVVTVPTLRTAVVTVQAADGRTTREATLTDGCTEYKEEPKPPYVCA